MVRGSGQWPEFAKDHGFRYHKAAAARHIDVFMNVRHNCSCMEFANTAASPKMPSIRAYLSTIAERAGIAFFLHKKATAAGNSGSGRIASFMS